MGHWCEGLIWVGAGDRSMDGLHTLPTVTDRSLLPKEAPALLRANAGVQQKSTPLQPEETHRGLQE